MYVLYLWMVLDRGTVQWQSAPAIQDMPVTSAIAEPLEEQTVSLDNDEILVKGYVMIVSRLHVWADKHLS